MPLQLVGTGEEEAHLAPGLAEEITTALARFRWMFLVSSNSLGAVRRRQPRRGRDPAHLRARLPARRHHPEVRNRLRITLRLLDLRAGNQVVWARRFDRQTHDLLTLQDEIAAEVVAQIDPEILLIEAKRVAARPPHRCHRLRPAAARPAADRPDGARARSCRRANCSRQAIAAGARLRRRPCLVRLLAHLPGRPGLGRGRRRPR